jgi:hypothetical protein
MSFELRMQRRLVASNFFEVESWNLPLLKYHSRDPVSLLMRWETALVKFFPN